MIPRDHSLATAVGGHWRIQFLGQLEHGRSGVLSTATDHDHWPLGSFDELGRRRQCRRVDCRIGLGANRTGHLEIRRRHHRVPAHLDRDRALPSRNHRPPGLGHRPVDVLGMLDAIGRLDERGQHCALVRHLVEVAALTPEKLGRHLPRHAHHRCVDTVGRAQRRASVQHARPRHHRIDRRPPCRLGIAERHVSRRLFVAS